MNEEEIDRRELEKPSPAAKRTRAERDRDIAEIVAPMYLRGKTHTEICEALNKVRPYKLSRSQITLDIKELNRRWQKQCNEAVTAVKARQLAVIDEVERAAWEAFERSLQASQRTTQESEAEPVEGKPDLQKKKRARVQRENRDGDPRWLDIVMRCVERRCKIIGVDAPTRGAIDLDAEVELKSANVATPTQTDSFDTNRGWQIVVAEAARLELESKQTSTTA